MRDAAEGACDRTRGATTSGRVRRRDGRGTRGGPGRAARQRHHRRPPRHGGGGGGGPERRESLKQLSLAAELVPPLGALLDLVRQRAAQAPPGEWIGGRNVDPNGMRGRRWPTRLELHPPA